jgi:hypothetical protein
LLVEPPLQLDAALVDLRDLVGQLGTNLVELLPTLGQFVARQSIMVGQLSSHLRDRPRERRRRQGALQLLPGFIDRQARFQRFALACAKLVGQTLQ